MLRFFTVGAVLCALAACAPTGGGTGGGGGGGGGGGDGGGGSDDPTANQAPASLAQNLATFEFASNGDSVTVTMSALDTVPLTATYQRNPALDQPGYLAYSVQQDALDRFFLALGAQSPDGSAESIVVSDGGQFNRVLPGVGYRRNGDYTPPDVDSNPERGQVSYVGDYVATTNLTSEQGGQLLGISGNNLPDLPGQPFLVNGTIFLNVSFADNVVNGEIFDRVLISPSDNLPILDLLDHSLILTDISDDGTFEGQVEVTGAPFEAKGSYGGIFAGDGAQYVAGGTSFNWDLSGQAINENGAFLLTQCGRDGDDPILCPLVQP